MAPSQPAPSFNEIIEAGRKRKKYEELANEVFSKGRRNNVSASGARPIFKASASLASRVTKPTNRSATSSPLGGARGQWKKPGTTVETRAAPVKKDLFEQLAQNSTRTQGKGFTIRGLAGPYVVVGSNFAPGTTSADIQSAMEAVLGAGCMESCTILTAAPTVIAEMVFSEIADAEKVIATFNNQKADGRLLHLYLKGGPPTALAPRPQPVARSVSAQVMHNERQYPEPIPVRPLSHGSSEVQAQPAVQDGSYGFEDRGEAMEIEQEKPLDIRPDPRYDERRDFKNTAEKGGDRRPEYYSDSRGVRVDSRRPLESYPRGQDNRRNPRYEDRGDYRGGRDGRGLYSDNIYRHPRGNGFH